jgi:hypothetical protein
VNILCVKLFDNDFSFLVTKHKAKLEGLIKRGRQFPVLMILGT